MGASARRRVLDLYDLDRNIEELSEIFRRRIRAAPFGIQPHQCE
jgi:hypothetical protein